MADTKTVIFNAENAEYYRAKKKRLKNKKEANRTIKLDALLVYFYGMDGYLKLVPDAINFGVSWHYALVEELQKLENKKLAQELEGIQMAYASTKDRKASRLFQRIINDLSRE